MLQPDIVIICDRNRLRRFGCYGAPDFVLEILSPSTARKDISVKLHKYIHAGVREIWIVNPMARQITAYQNQERELAVQNYTFEDKVPVWIWEGSCMVDFAEIQEEIGFLYDLKE